MAKTTPVTLALDSLCIPYRLHEHDHPIRTLEQAAEERGLTPDQIVRSLLFRLTGGTFILVLMPGVSRVSWPKLRSHLGVSRVTTATAQEVREVTGYEIGTVSPFGLNRPLQIMADQRILDHEILSLGAGVRNAGIILKRDDVVSALQPTFGDFSES
jgi:Cys-tRNA(Pro)/Cys-tRNA(Cys) deacylase